MKKQAPQKIITVGGLTIGGPKNAADIRPTRLSENRPPLNPLPSCELSEGELR
jgi:hypothetical protein